VIGPARSWPFGFFALAFPIFFNLPLSERVNASMSSGDSQLALAAQQVDAYDAFGYECFEGYGKREPPYEGFMLDDRTAEKFKRHVGAPKLVQKYSDISLEGALSILLAVAKWAHQETLRIVAKSRAKKQVSWKSIAETVVEFKILKFDCEDKASHHVKNFFLRHFLGVALSPADLQKFGKMVAFGLAPFFAIYGAAECLEAVSCILDGNIVQEFTYFMIDHHDAFKWFQPSTAEIKDAGTSWTPMDQLFAMMSWYLGGGDAMHRNGLKMSPPRDDDDTTDADGTTDVDETPKRKRKPQKQPLIGFGSPSSG
jgi:hypothetical protein